MAYAPMTDWKTSKKNVVPDLHLTSADFTPAEKAAYKQQVEYDFPNVTVVADATRTFNCHGYAHAQSHAWFNTPQQFIDDDYEPYTPGQLMIGDVVVYVYQADMAHSGVIKALSGNTVTAVRSKWGDGPQVSHSPTDVPAEYGSIIYYLRKLSMLVSSKEERSALAKDAIEDLLYQLTTHPKLADLVYASTSETALAMIRSIPQIAGLSLYGPRAEEPLLRSLEETQGPAELAVIYALGSLATKGARQALAKRVAALSEDVDPVRDGVLIDAFLRSDSDKESRRRAAIAAAKAELK